MAHITWTSDLNTGIQVIDEQHKQLVAYINQLYDAKKTKERSQIAHVIDGVVDYTMSHFAFEEAMLEDVGYEFLRPHKKVHELFIRRVDDLRKRFNAGEDVSDELHDLLSRWLLNHIRHDDAAYVQAVRGDLQELEKDNHEGGWLKRTLGRFFGR